MTHPSNSLDVVAIGSAIVDVLSRSTDEFLAARDLVKGSMALIDADQADALYEAVTDAVEASGGSAANTAAGVGSFGGQVGFIGKVRDDVLGAAFTSDIRSLGVEFATTPATSGAATARCLIFVTPDAQRTMNTYLGIAGSLSVDDVDPELVARAAVVYAEGYLWDAPPAKEALEKAFAIARAAGNTTAFTLSDAFCVDRFRDEFTALIRDHVDIVFANEAEVCSLYQVDKFDEALTHVQAAGGMWALTRSERGSVVVHNGEAVAVPAAPVTEVVDTTGAGDLYAAGFLFGHTRGLAPADCARLGSLAASEVISHIGARPLVDLTGLIPDDLRTALS